MPKKLLRQASSLSCSTRHQLLTFINQIEGFLREKENIFDRLYDIADDFNDRAGEQVTDLQREEVDRIIDLYRQKAKMAWNTVMSQELTLVSQTEQVILVDISKLFVKSTQFMPNTTVLENSTSKHRL